MINDIKDIEKNIQIIERFKIIIKEIRMRQRDNLKGEGKVEIKKESIRFFVKKIIVRELMKVLIVVFIIKFLKEESVVKDSLKMLI